MTEKQIKQRKTALEKSGGVCAVCGKPLYNSFGQYAHKIANTEPHRKKYGSFFIDSVYNGLYVCSLSCNKKVDVGNSPAKIFETLADILMNEIKDFKGL